MLAKVRNEKLYRALGHDSIEDYAEKRLGLRRFPLSRPPSSVSSTLFSII